MKKILISMAIIIILILLYITVINGLTVGSFKIESIQGIKGANQKLDAKEEEAKKVKEQDFEENVKSLKTAINRLVDVKKEYEIKIKNAEEEAALGTTTLKKYEIGFLWANVDTHAKRRGLDLKMDVKQGFASGGSALDFTIVGSYTGITEFIYDIENDENLNFRVENFVITPSVIEATSEAPNEVNTASLQATFTVPDIEVSLN